MESGKFSFEEFLLATRDGVWAIGAIAIIFGGIYSGVFSPTEAAGVACIYAIIVSYFVYRETTLHRDLRDRRAFDVPDRISSSSLSRSRAFMRGC